MSNLPLLDSAIESIRRDHLDVYKFAFSKRVNFNHPDYCNFKVAQLAIASHLMAPIIVPEARTNAIDQHWCVAAIKLARHEWPVFHLQPAFAEAVHVTNPPPDIKLNSLKMPFEAFCVALPREFSRRLFGCDIPFLTFSQISDGEVVEIPKILRRYRMESHWENEGAKLFYGGVCLSTKDHIPLNYGSILRPEWTVQEMTGYECEELTNPLLNSPDFINTELSAEEEIRLPYKLNAYCTKLLAILNTAVKTDSSPLLASSIQKIVKKGESCHTYHNPVWIAPGYRAVSEASGDGTHASPRMHWRRGHVRRQHYGPGMKSERLVWIEPVLVNAVNKGE